jgi:hypothetical protein
MAKKKSKIRKCGVRATYHLRTTVSIMVTVFQNGINDVPAAGTTTPCAAVVVAYVILTIRTKTAAAAIPFSVH